MGFWTRVADVAGRVFSEPEPRGVPDCDPDRDAAFSMAVIGLGAKLAKADGVVTPDEIRAFRHVFQPAPEAEAEADFVFSLAQQTSAGYEGYAKRLARRWRACPGLLEDVLDGLFCIAAADGDVSEPELAYLKRVSEIFGMGESEFDRMRASWLESEPEDPYVVLGVEASISDEDLRRAYRRLAAANHPDRIAARGLPLEAARLATAKMAAINAAYNTIQARRRA